MKHIKKYESKSYNLIITSNQDFMFETFDNLPTHDYLSYKVGDYVLCNWKYNKLSKIISVINIDNKKRSYDYFIEYLIDDTKLFKKDMIGEEQIERKMTEDEIFKYDMIQNSNKYNL